jgi:hypothetical protein
MLKLRVAGLAVICFLFAGTCGLASSSSHRRMVVGWNVPVTPPEGSHLNWYEMKADPEDANNLIVCGAMRSAKDNAYYGVLYSSRDGGKSWRQVIEDRGSTWVSEQSCAFGEHHRAYFVSEASEVVDGELHHSLGTTRIFVSRDGGESWLETAKTGWADFSSSVVARTHGSDARELYVFYNSDSNLNKVKQLGSTLDFFTVSEDGATVSQRQTVPGMAERNYQGVYPSSSVMLNDGTPIALYTAAKETESVNGIAGSELGVVRFSAVGPPALTVVATPSSKNEPTACFASLSNSLAYDRAHDRLFVAYNDFTRGHCAVMLANSGDGGRTWSPAQELRLSAESHSSMYFPVLAVNQDGVIGLLWSGKSEGSPDCWHFSISSDGRNLEDTVSLSGCGDSASLKQQSSAYLATIISQAKGGQAASVELLTFRDYLTRVAIAATSDGVFHPLWSTVGDGVGELRTARVRFCEALQSDAKPPQSPVLKDVTDKITVLYGGEQRLDHESNSVMLDLSFRNDGLTTMRGPFYVKLNAVTSDYGKIELVTPGPSCLDTEYVEITCHMKIGSLAPGETTPPCQLRFQFKNEDSVVSNRYTVLRIQLRLFVREAH